MPEKKTKAQVPGIGLVDVAEVAVSESTERWTEVHLEDGSVLRFKPVVVGALRLENRWDPEGNPLYSLKVNQVMVLVSAPEHLHKPVDTATKH